MSQSIPTRQGLEQLVLNGVPEVAELLIKQHKLKYKIVDGRLVDYAEGTESWLNKFVTVNKQMLALKDYVRKLANVNDPVLIVGPTGTGKELLAHALHGDRDGRFIGVNCAGLPDNLVESELFGHVAGSFTDAKITKRGLMSEADNGTLFLDEIGDFPLSVQPKLLRAIQERLIRKVGSSKEEDINCRIVCATHRNLQQRVKDDLFRVDLYARISTFELDTLDLSERPEDIIPIAKSISGGDKWLDARAKCNTPFDISLNVRSLIKSIRKYEVLGIL